MFQQTDVSCHQCRSSKTKNLPERKIPGHNGEDWAKRLKMNVTLFCIRIDSLVCKMMLCVVCIVSTSPRTFLSLTDSCFEGLAHFQGHQSAEFVFVTFKDFRGMTHHLCASGERRSAVTLESFSGARKFFFYLVFV